MASPLTFAPSGTGAKRSLACSPQLIDLASLDNLSIVDISEEQLQRSVKRRRLLPETTVDALPEDYTAHSTYLKTKNAPSTKIASSLAGCIRRQRHEFGSPMNEDLKKLVREQSIQIESLKTEKLDIASSLNMLKVDREKISKENQILRRAVTIQQERYQSIENDLKNARKERFEADERIRVLEQMILSLRYHLQAQQTHAECDFFNHRPPDVF